MYQIRDNSVTTNMIILCGVVCQFSAYDDVIIWKSNAHHWPFVTKSTGDSMHKGPVMRVLGFSLCWPEVYWANSRVVGDLKRSCDVTVMALNSWLVEIPMYTHPHPHPHPASLSLSLSRSLSLSLSLIHKFRRNYLSMSKISHKCATKMGPRTWLIR